MPAFNFFRVFPHEQKSLTSHLMSKGVALIDQKDVNDNGTAFHYELYFTQTPPKKPIRWLKDLQQQFTIQDFQTENYSAVVLITFLGHAYALTFGPSHLLVSKYADLEFGIDIAARILSKYKLKNSREFGGVKVKSIETYLMTDELPFDAGEAVSYIKGVPVSTSEWGSNVSCGQSVQVSKKTLSLSNVHRMCAQLEKARSSQVLREIPKAAPVKGSPEVKALVQRLISDMKNGHCMITISQQQLSGVAFLFADQHDFICHTSSKETFTVDEHLSLKALRTRVQKHFGGDYEKLLRATVEAQDDGNTVYFKPFIAFIDYIDTENNHYLDDGKWYKFDTNYLSNVRNEVDRIPLRVSSEMPTFDENAYQTWLITQPEQYYRERYLNNLLEQKYHYINHDRSIKIFEGASTEITDLIKGDTIFVVKFGTPQKLNYAIDQALSAVKVLERQAFQIPVNGSTHTVQKLCLWLFLERKTPIKRISEINSLIFLMKLAHWRKSVLLSGLQPEVRISYKND